VVGHGGGAAGDAFYNMGVLAGGGGEISSGGSGALDIQGTGGAAGGFRNYGVQVGGPFSVIGSAGGNVTIVGTGGGRDGAYDNYGVDVSGGGLITAGGTGSVTVIGTGGSGASYEFGVYVQDTATLITSSGGDVSVTGYGGDGNGIVNRGIWVNWGQIRAGGTGDTNVLGQGGNGTGGSNLGVYVVGNTGIIASSGGDVNVTGIGGGSGNGANYGVILNSAGRIRAEGAGNLMIDGTAGAKSAVSIYNFGVWIIGTSSISSTGGTVKIDARGTGTAEAFRMEGSGRIGSFGGDITISADSVNMIGTSVTVDSGAGTTIIQPLSAGTKIDLGGADVLTGSVLTLGLSSAELNSITAGRLIIGRDDIATGTVTVSSAVSPLNANALTVTTARDIVVNANLTGGAQGLTLRANQQATTTAENFDGIRVLSGARVTTLGNGAVSLAGRGGDVSGLFNAGVTVWGAGSTVTSSGGPVEDVGRAGGIAASSNNYGVLLAYAGLISAGDTGSVVVSGTGGGGTGSSNLGIFVDAVGSAIRSGGGSVSV